MPPAVDDPIVSVMVEDPEPGATIDAGLNATVVPVGSPLALKATAELKPPETAVVTVDVPLLPCPAETEVGEPAKVNAATVTVRETVAVCVRPPPVPVKVTE